MRLSWGALIVVLALAGLSGCAGVQQRGQSSSPMRGLSVDAPGRPGWPTSRFFQWRTAAANSRIETSRRVAPETDIWPDRSRSLLSRLWPSTRPAKAAPGAGGSSLSLRDSSSFSGRLTVAEANEAIARAARPRPETKTQTQARDRTRDTLVLTAKRETEADAPTTTEAPDTPPLLTASIPLPELGPGGNTEAVSEEAAKPEANASTSDPDAVLAQAPPPPPLRPTPKPVEPTPEPEAPKVEPEAPKVEPQPEPTPEPEAPKVEPTPEPEPKPEPDAPKVEPKPEPAPEPEAAEVSPPVAPAAPRSEPEPEVKPEPTPTSVTAPEPAIAPAAEQEATSVQGTTPTYRQAMSPFPTAQETRYEPVVMAAPQAYFDSPAPARVEAPKHRWVFWPWKRSRHIAAARPVEASAQLPPIQFPGSYDSIAARPLVPCPDYARVVTPTAQQQVVLPSAQGAVAAPAAKKSHLRALGACLHDKLERFRAWKEDHICRHIQNFKAALKGHKCQTCGGHPAPVVRPMASPQSSPVLATSQFGLY